MDALRRAQQAEAEGRIGLAAQLYRQCSIRDQDGRTALPELGRCELLTQRADELESVMLRDAPPHLLCPISLKFLVDPVR
jgi:hypothetical protein